MSSYFRRGGLCEAESLQQMADGRRGLCVDVATDEGRRMLSTNSTYPRSHHGLASFYV